MLKDGKWTGHCRFDKNALKHKNSHCGRFFFISQKQNLKIFLKNWASKWCDLRPANCDLRPGTIQKMPDYWLPFNDDQKLFESRRVCVESAVRQEINGKQFHTENQFWPLSQWINRFFRLQNCKTIRK